MKKAEILNALGRELDALRETGAQHELVASTPKPILLIEWNGRWQEREFESAIMFLTFALSELVAGRKAHSVVRCVESERLPLILQQGCDVQPTDSVLWTDKFPSKALEYGGDEKVMMVFDIRRTEPSYQEVPADTDQKALDELRKAYPTVERSIDGSMLWLSRLPEHDKRVTTPYEVEHGRWIPDDPFEALMGLLVLGRDMKKLAASVKSRIAVCQQPVWE